MKNVAWKNIAQAIINFLRTFCKKDSEQISMLIRTNFDSFAITYVI